MTTNDRIIKKVMNFAPDICVCVGWDGNKEPLSIVERAIVIGAQKVQLFKPYFNQQSVDKAHQHGIICNVFWADDPEEAILLFLHHPSASHFKYRSLKTQVS